MTPDDHTRSAEPPSPGAGPVEEALKHLPGGIYLLTACYDGERSGLRVHAAMQCATEPVLVAAAARKGHSIEPLIRDSHRFALCVVSPDDRLLISKFPEGCEPAGGGDPFDSVPNDNLGSGSPVPRRCLAAFDCEVVRHFDLEADHEIYVGQVLAARVYKQEA